LYIEKITWKKQINLYPFFFPEEKKHDFFLYDRRVHNEMFKFRSSATDFVSNKPSTFNEVLFAFDIE